MMGAFILLINPLKASAEAAQSTDSRCGPAPKPGDAEETGENGSGCGLERLAVTQAFIM